MTQIIFNSQEEFEDAVMEVVRKRTELSVYSDYDGRRVVMLLDNGNAEDLISKSDFWVNT